VKGALSAFGGRAGVAAETTLPPGRYSRSMEIDDLDPRMRGAVRSGSGWKGVAAMALFLAGFAFIADNLRPFETAAIQRDGESAGTLVGELVGRDYIIRIRAGEDGPLFTVCDPDGRILESDLRADEVNQHFPDLDMERLHFEAEAGDGSVRIGTASIRTDHLP
jgi:hypothetical protein